jgi:hypothetical protein
MMAQQDPVGTALRIDIVTGPPRRAFESIVALAFDIDPHNLQGNRPGIAQRLAKAGPSIGLGTQAMVDVQGLDGAPKGVGNMQQDDRIDAAGEPDDQSRARGRVTIQAGRSGGMEQLSGEGLP